MEFDFDLENCQVELERVRDLLTIVIEFMDEELPAKPEFDYETVLFARRAGTFGSVKALSIFSPLIKSSAV